MVEKQPIKSNKQVKITDVLYRLFLIIQHATLFWKIVYCVFFLLFIFKSLIKYGIAELENLFLFVLISLKYWNPLLVFIPFLKKVLNSSDSRHFF